MLASASRRFRNLSLLAAAGLALAAMPVRAQEGAAAPAPVMHTDWSQSKLDVWNDPAFQKQFIGAYGMNADIEPRISPEEVAALEKIRPLMGSDLPKAQAELLKIVKPDSSAILDFTLAGIYFQQDKLADALANYKKSVEKYPSFRRAWRNLGLIHVREGRHDDAIAAFTKMIELGGGDAYSFGLLGYAYASKQDFQAAEVAYRNALLLQPGNTEWRLGVTRCVFKEQKYEDAIALLETLIQEHPEKTDFWMLQAQAYLGVKQPLKAAQDLEAIDRLGKGTADALHTLGDIYFSENLMDLACRSYVKAIDADEKRSLAAPLRSAEMLASRGAFGQAREVVDHIRKVRGEKVEDADRKKLLKLDARLSMADGQSTTETAKILEEVVSLDPLDGEALLLLGQHYSKQGQPDRAIFYYERAESIDAFEANAKIRHAQALVSMNRYADAVPLLRRAQEIKPKEDVARYLEQVERISKTR